jgi:hypothetical protein
MLEKIKEAVFAKYKKEDTYWIFLSVFDENNNLLMSNWALYTDKVLDSILDTLYHWLVEKHTNISYIVVDIVTKEEELTDWDNLNEIPLDKYWIALIAWWKYWATLPNTQWINNITDALKAIKQKNWLEWNAKIIKFQTDRITVQEQ